MKLSLSILLTLSVTALVRGACDAFGAYNADQDPAVSVQSGGHTIYLFDTSLTQGVNRFVFDESGGSFTLDKNRQEGRLTGNLIPADATSADNGYQLDFVVSTAPNAGFDGMNELLESVDVNVDAWKYFVLLPSTLTGFGSFAGSNLLISIQHEEMPFQIGFGANGKNLNYGAAAWLFLSDGINSVTGDINIDLNCTVGIPPLCPSMNLRAYAADVDAFAQFTGGAALTVFDSPSILDSIQSFIFAEDSGRIEELENGEFHLTGQIVGHPAATSSSLRLQVDLYFRQPSQPELLDLSMMPFHKELVAEAYAALGGPINPASDWFFAFLVEEKSSISSLDGVIQMTLATHMMMPAQIGLGASGKNVLFGASGWFDYTILLNGEQVHAGMLDININLDCIPESDMSSSASASENVPECASLQLTPMLRTSWVEGSRTIKLYDVTAQNIGTEALKDVTFMIQHEATVGCSAGQCQRQIWNLRESELNDGVHYRLPAWLTDFQGLLPGASFTFGLIAESSSVEFVASC